MLQNLLTSTAYKIQIQIWNLDSFNFKIFGFFWAIDFQTPDPDPQESGHLKSAAKRRRQNFEKDLDLSVGAWRLSSQCHPSQDKNWEQTF